MLISMKSSFYSIHSLSCIPDPPPGNKYKVFEVYYVPSRSHLWSNLMLFSMKSSNCIINPLSSIPDPLPANKYKVFKIYYTITSLSQYVSKISPQLILHHVLDQNHSLVQFHLDTCIQPDLAQVPHHAPLVLHTATRTWQTVDCFTKHTLFATTHPSVANWKPFKPLHFVFEMSRLNIFDHSNPNLVLETTHHLPDSSTAFKVDVEQFNSASLPTPHPRTH